MCNLALGEQTLIRRKEEGAQCTNTLFIVMLLLFAGLLYVNYGKWKQIEELEQESLRLLKEQTTLQDELSLLFNQTKSDYEALNQKRKLIELFRSEIESARKRELFLEKNFAKLAERTERAFREKTCDLNDLWSMIKELLKQLKGKYYDPFFYDMDIIFKSS